MNLRGVFIAVALSTALVVSGCGAAAGAVAATVNGRDISRSEFERELRALAENEELQALGGEGLTGTGRETVSADLSAGWLTAVIYDVLITEEFERRRLTITDEDREAAEAQLATQFGNPGVANAFPEWFRIRVSERNARALVVRTALSGVSLTEEGFRQYYDDNPDEFMQVCLSHILVQTEEEAASALARIRGGEAFAAVAREVSADPGSGQRGGDLDCNPRGVFVTEFDEAAFSVPLNRPSDPVQTQFGFHILLVRERSVQPFDQVRSQARAAVDNLSQEAFGEFLASAARRATVTVDARYGTFVVDDPRQAPRVVAPPAPDPADRRPSEQDEIPGLPGVPAPDEPFLELPEGEDAPSPPPPG